MATADKVARAAESLEQTGIDNGGPYQEPDAYRGSCARTMFDRPGAEDGTVTALLPEQQIGVLRREAFVRIPSTNPRTHDVETEYLGVVTSGPFAEPDALAATAPTLIVAAAHGAVLTPKYHGIAHIEVFAERADDALIPPLSRPAPNSPVFLLDNPEVEKVLGLNLPPDEKPFRLGLLDGPSQLAVQVSAARKAGLFKHTAILGTTGGGKSTTVSGIMRNLAGAENAVVVFDIEGEYTTMDRSTSNPQMKAALAKRHLRPAGAPQTKLFCLVGREPSNPDHPSICRFKIAFDELSPFVLVEVLDLSEAQERRMLDAYEICRIVMERAKIYPSNDHEQQEALDHDELDSGWPRMTIDMMLDIVSAAIENIEGTGQFTCRAPAFRNLESTVLQTLNARKPEKDVRSWKAIAKRLWRMKKAGVFATAPDERMNVTELMVPGQISIIDLSDMDAPYMRNLVIAQILRSLQAHQDELYRIHEAALRSKAPAEPIVRVNIFIEEAHEFLSAQRIKQMPNLFDQVARIARRGRKRYLGLVFVTQLPSHLPDEVFGLVNNWVLHKLTDTAVIQRLRKVVPAVSNATWLALPNLAPGQALCSFTHLTRPVMVAIDPSPCQLRMVD